MICTAVHQPYAATLAEEPTACMREVDEAGRHIGNHQAISTSSRLVTWDSGGSSSMLYDPDVPNTNCMCRNKNARMPHRPEDHRWASCATCGVIFDAKKPDPADCIKCEIWAKRVEEYGQVIRDRRAGRWGRAVRQHPDQGPLQLNRLYGWAQGYGGAFGGLQYQVTWDDGQKAGPADFLWDSGAIPWWLDEKFPPNASVAQGGQVVRAGHTDAWGQPLRYNGGG